MSTMLPDGSVWPSFLPLSSPDPVDTSYTETVLRVGFITKVYSPSDSGSFSKKFVEYDVQTTYAMANGGFAPISFSHVTVASLFGGVADYFRWTPRYEDYNPGSNLGLGSKVLLLCINGNVNSAFIIGGIPHPETKKSDLSFQDSPYIDFEFNGINFNINKNGELNLLHRGATNADGSVPDTTGENSLLSFTEDGNISLGYQNFISSDYTSLVLNKQQKTFNIFAVSNISNVTQDKFLIKTTNGVKINQGGLDSQAFLRGSVYRQQQIILHNQLKVALNAMGPLISVASNALSTAGKDPTLVGVASTAAGALNIAGLTLNQLTSFITQITTAIDIFESFSEQYLSKKHEFAENP